MESTNPHSMTTTPGDNSEPRYDVVWPKSPLGVQSSPLAPRLDDLNGARIGFLWDYVFRGDELFPLLRQELEARYPTCEIVDYTVFGNTHGADEKEMIASLPEVLRSERVDAVVSGVGC